MAEQAETTKGEKPQAEGEEQGRSWPQKSRLNLAVAGRRVFYGLIASMAEWSVLYEKACSSRSECGTQRI